MFKKPFETLPAEQQLFPEMEESIEALPAVQQLCPEMEESIEALPAVQQLCPEMEESTEALPAEQQETPNPQKEEIIKYDDVLSISELEDLIKAVDDDDDDDDNDDEEEDVKISRSQHECNCKEWEKMLKYIKIPHYYIELIMEANDVVLPENSERLEFPIRPIFRDTVLLMNEALVLEAAFRLGMKHSTEWTLESDLDELEAEINRARTTPLTDSLSMFLKRGPYLRLKDIRPSETLLPQPQHLKRSRNLGHERCLDPSGPSQKKRPCRSHVAHLQEAIRQKQQLESLRDQTNSKAFFNCGTSSDSVSSPESGSSCVSGSRRQHNQHRLLSPDTAERLKNEMSLRVKLINEALKDRPKSKAGHRRSASNSSSSSCVSSSDSDSSSASDSSCGNNTRLENNVAPLNSIQLRHPSTSDSESESDSAI